MITDTYDTRKISLQDASEFIWAEAALLDAREYSGWLDLWTDEGLYVVPISQDDGDPADRLNIAYDDKQMREARTKRLMSGDAVSASPPARTVRTISRFTEEPGHRGTTVIRCAMILVEYKYDRTRVIGSDVRYELTISNNRILMNSKVVKIINSDSSFHGIGYIL